jgi:hypothetical protein
MMIDLGRLVSAGVVSGMAAAATVWPGASTHAADAAFSDQTASTQVIASHDPLYGESFLAGGTVGDFDNDGWQDIYVATGGGAPDRLFINNGDGTFTDRAAQWGIDVTHRSTAGAAGDYDGDGWLDLFVTSLGPTSNNAVGHHKLYRNNGDPKNPGFIDQAVLAGVNQSSQFTADGWGAAWGDYDLDGDLDLAVAGWNTNDGNRVYLNEGNGQFTDVTSSIGLSGISGIAGFAPRFIDMDDDRYPELIWIGDFSTSRYYKNDGDGTFTDVTNASGTSLDGTEMGCDVADIDEDGDFDFYVSTINSNNLYINQGNNVYSNMANSAGVASAGWGWAVVAMDMNHDSLVDLIQTEQGGRQYAFLNTTAGGGLDFDEVALQIGLSTNVSGRGLSRIDYDNDGDQDLVFFPRNDPIKVYRNDVSGADANWIRIFLDRGDATDIAPNGIGSVIKLTFDGGRQLISRIDGGSNYLSQNEMSAHFGLGAEKMLDTVTVEWTNGQITTLSDVAVNQTLVIEFDACPLDLDGQTGVGVGDLLVLLSLWGPCADCDADLDNDGTIGVSDLLVLLSGWGSCTG